MLVYVVDVYGVSCEQVRAQNFSLGGADPEAVYNLYLILKIVL
jgi:hypothetical protein